MNEYILTNEAAIRAASFFGIFIVVALWEPVGPRRKLSVSKGLGWINNLGIVFFNTLLLRFLAPLMAVGLAIMAEEENWGLLNNIAINSYVKMFHAVLILNLIIYLQHVMFHTFPLLWRLHRMHHTDLDFDVTTGSRFHPIEIILSMIIKMLIVAALGAPPVAVVIFEVLLNATAMFNHGNIRIHINADRILRLLVVTPDMHRVHHSVKPDETNSNYGFNFPWWNRLLGTYKAQPEDNHLKMTIGLNQFRESRYLRFHWLLIQPFVGKLGEYPIRKQ
jgi:sterol desaturase/sphingolipid hydroxylase (fatty acid hydroxylase superfamily)